MSRETIKNFSGQIIAYIDTSSDGTQTLKNYSGTILGYYNPKRNITQNYSGKILAEGNALGMLIPNESKKAQESAPTSTIIDAQKKPSEWRATSTYYEESDPNWSDSHIIEALFRTMAPPFYGMVKIFGAIIGAIRRKISHYKGRENKMGGDTIEPLIKGSPAEVFVGQDKIVEKIDILVKKAKSSKKPLPHLLFVAESGMGKSTLAYMIARELNVKIINESSATILGNLVGVLTNLDERDIVLIDKIDALDAASVRGLRQALDTCEISVVIDAKTYKFNVKPFTLIAATSNPNKLNSDLKNSFFSIYRFGPYSADEITQIIMNKAKICQIEVEGKESLKLIAQKSNGLPSEGVRLFDKVIKFAKLANIKLITNDIIQECLNVSES